MKTQEFSADVPSITLRFLKDAGKRTAALAAALAQEAQDAANQKQIAFKEIMRVEAAPLGTAMFACFRDELRSQMAARAAEFEPEVSKLSAAVTALAGQVVPEDDPNFVNAKGTLDGALAKRAEALKPFEEALEKLAASEKAAMEQFAGVKAGAPPSLPKGGLMAVGAKSDIYGSLRKKSAPKGLCISIGLNSVDPLQYNGWAGMLNACEADAKDLAAIAGHRGFETKTLLTSAATATSVLASLADAANRLVSGDILVLGYSGHGSQVDDVHIEEADSKDETWVLYDRMIIDDELYAMWSKFRAGVRILVLSDSCHSGSVTKEAFYKEFLANAPRTKDRIGDIRPKAMPFEQAVLAYMSKKSTYDELQLIAGSSEKADVLASVILISACQDNQLANDGIANSAFTAIWKSVLSNGSFAGNYKKFHHAILGLSPPTQTPNYFMVGATNMEFEAQQPFTI